MTRATPGSVLAVHPSSGLRAEGVAASARGGWRELDDQLQSLTLEALVDLQPSALEDLPRFMLPCRQQNSMRACKHGTLLTSTSPNV